MVCHALAAGSGKINYKDQIEKQYITEGLLKWQPVQYTAFSIYASENQVLANSQKSRAVSVFCESVRRMSQMLRCAVCPLIEKLRRLGYRRCAFFTQHSGNSPTASPSPIRRHLSKKSLVW